ncbi:hypothetical protein LEM8419_01542 [Neolewinella maritima]|uniref:DUF2490 domain-containing protein n=1 Tax=Neolewinella maritima TaxID=1383882 RepID=A0ABM9AZY0_9BACT|nr:DUF2490 domain-containing protein [Neolewinella maritima]CAH1000389.1 hypothetical protein LEM8419_01542 [Neolewinella maritima]
MQPLTSRIIVACLILASTVVLGQHSLFTGVSFEHEVTPRYGYEFEVEHRKTLGTGVDNRVLLLFAINRKVGDRVNVAPGVRLTPRYGPQDPTVLRLFTDINYKLSLGESPFSLEGRLRTQYERNINAEAGHEVAVRPRIGLVYKLLEFTEVVAEYELRYRFDRRNEVVRHRYTFGVGQKVSTRVSVEAFYRLERDANVPEPETSPTIGLYVSYVLPDRRDRDWEYRRPFGRRLLF